MSDPMVQYPYDGEFYFAGNMEAFKSANELMTGQEWLGEFIDEFMEEFKGRKYITPEGSIVDYELEKDIRKWVAAKRASVLEEK